MVIVLLDSTTLETTDMRSIMTGDDYCMTFLFDNQEKYGSVTAYDPGSGLLL